MKGRDFLLVAALAVLVSASSAVLAQAADKVWRLGVLSPIDDPMMNTTLSELAARGYVEGRNLIVDRRVGAAEQLPELAQELVSMGPDVIMAVSDWAVEPARKATKSIPIVMSPIGRDPVTAGLVESWARPGGNLTASRSPRRSSRSSGSICCAKLSRRLAASPCCRCTVR